jgi:hypothetical protein
MWRLVSFALLSAAAAWAQTAGPEGTWHSDEKFNGEPRVVIVLRTVDGKLGGTVTMRGVTDDDNNSTTLNLVIDSATVEGGKISFQAKMPDENITEWEMTLAGSTATASIIGDRDGPYSDPQKWRMKRAESSATTTSQRT